MECKLFYKNKKSKSEFREALRAAFDEYQSSIVKQIENDIDVDQKSVWTILNKRKQKPSVQSLEEKGYPCYR
jgi:type I site-specific restriction endonuclease